MKNPVALAVIIGSLLISFSAQAQQQALPNGAQYMDAQLVPTFTIVGQYGADLVAGRATPAETGACQGAMNQLAGLATQGSSPAATPRDKTVGAEIQKQFAQMDVNPCPTIASFQAGGNTAFTTPYDLSTPDGAFAAEKAGMLQRLNIIGQYDYNIQHNVQASAASWQQAQQSCAAALQALNNFTASAQQEAKSPSGMTPGDASLYGMVTGHLQDPRLALGCAQPPASAVMP